MVGVSRGACGQWERGTTTPSVTNLSRLAVILDVRFEWLATGHGGQQYDPQVREESLGQEPAVAFMSTDQREMLEIYVGLTPKRQMRLLEFMRTL